MDGGGARSPDEAKALSAVFNGSVVMPARRLRSCTTTGVSSTQLLAVTIHLAGPLRETRFIAEFKLFSLPWCCPHPPVPVAPDSKGVDTQ